MLFLFLVHVIICVVCLIAGFLFYSCLLKPETGYKPIIVYLITGLIAISMAGQLLILFFPMNNYSRLVLLLILLGGLIMVRRKIPPFLRYLRVQLQDCSPLILITICICWCLILLMNAGPVILDDTESYHIQMVKWIQEYGTVPGLANLHGRFGFNSSWFTAIAVFTIPDQQHNYFGSLNGVTSFWFSAYLLCLSGKRLLEQNSEKTTSTSLLPLFLLFFSLLTWPLIRGSASNCNYDFISTVVIFILFTETIFPSAGSGKPALTFEWIMWPVFLFTVRILNYPFLLLSAYGLFLLYSQGKTTVIAFCLLICFFLVTPFLARNVILSGYPFFPSVRFDWFAFDWKADRGKTLQLMRYIKYFNRVNAGYQSIETTAALQFPQWVFAWYRNLFTYDKLMLLPGLAGIVLSPFLIRSMPAKIKSASRIFLYVFFAQLLSWFFIAPDPRFIYNILLCGILLLFIPAEKLLQPLADKWHRLILMLLIVALPVFSMVKILGNTQYRNWVRPFILPQPPVRNFAIGVIRFHLPEKILNNWNPRCYATELPCLYEIDPGLEPRGTSLAAGFKIKK